MFSRPNLRHSTPGACCRGFTLIEMIIVITALGLLLAVGVPKVGRQISRYRLGRTAVVVAGDLEQALSMAARSRKPIRFACCSSGTYTLTERNTGTTRLTRNLAKDSDYGVRTVTASTSPIDFFPSGLTSLTATETITISNPAGSRRITLTPAGQVRILQ
ncbi:MAG TPA: GspH/FimT family pseudopilin [Gemmatimonadales bacterium]|nr:GspH/FimT family pseudopilin [Gemmatimonadales bacterium]